MDNRLADVHGRAGLTDADLVGADQAGREHVALFQEHWITYRSTAEALKHERYLYLAQAGPYVGEDRHRQLAERLEGLVSQEHAKWTASHPEARVRSHER
jgi:hypothetical protein